MDNSPAKECLFEYAAALDAGEFGLERAAALYSAAITTSDADLQEVVLSSCVRTEIPSDALYEVLLQSYLFLGFPRMLQAAEIFHRIIHKGLPVQSTATPEVANIEEWTVRGESLCRRVYGDKYEPLRRKVEHMAPEIMQWMILEGYGKVLSRPSLHIVVREVAIVACLMVENHAPQLRAHINGALNIGADRRLIETVVNDLGAAFPRGWATATDELRKALQRQ